MSCVRRLLRRRSPEAHIDRNISLTDLQEGLVSDRSRDRAEPLVVSTGRFTTEAPNDFLALARGTWLCIIGISMVFLFCAFLIYEMTILMKTMWYLSYLLFLVFPPLGLVVNRLWTKLRCQLKDGCCAVIHIRSEGRNSYLLEAVSAILRKVIQSGEADLVIEREEKTVGNWSWQASLVPSTKTCSLRVNSMDESKVVELISTQAEPVVCGPKHEIVRPREVELRIMSNSVLQMLALPCWPAYSIKLFAKRATEMKFLQNWIDDVYGEYMRARRGTVEVLELQKDSADWPPEWQSVRKDTAVRGDVEYNSEVGRPSAMHSTADMRSSEYYFVQDWAKRMMKHADFAMKHSGRMRTTLFLHGQKGSGKTLFVEWLASDLGLPIYYIDLRASFLDDSVLRDALTPRKLRHNLPVLFHFDEFQSMIEAWADSAEPGSKEQSLQAPPTRVTIQGLQSVLEGISTPSNALFVFTGSRDLPELESLPLGPVRHEWEGVLRRLPVREMIPPIGRDVTFAFVSHFLAQYLPETAIRKSHFDQLEQVWDLGKSANVIPFDMVSKYCQHQLRDAFIDGLVVVDRDGMRVPPEYVDSFLECVFDVKRLGMWRDSYAGGKLQTP